MRVRDIMTRNVITVPPDTPVLALARLLAERGISAVPVTDGWGMLLGIVSEADLIRRLAAEAAPSLGLLQSLFYDRDRAAAEYTAVHGATAAALMTKDVITITESASVEHAAQLLEAHNVRRLPVVHDGVLLGIVSRADLLRALLVPAVDASDKAIHQAMATEMARLPWADAPFVFFDVHEGVVSLHGFCHSGAVRRGLVAMAKALPGVRSVQDGMTDTRLAVPA